MKIPTRLYIALLVALPLVVAAAPVPKAVVPSIVQFESLKDATQKAVLNNPEVQARWHAFLAAEEETNASRGGFLPRVDVTAGAGRERLVQPGLPDLSYNRRGYTAALNQMLFDGFATLSDVRRLNKAQLARYYELLDASENAALEAARAYYDVIRYRYLVSLAEDNYVQHKATYEQLVRRTQSGVGRRADMEQAGSRLALAESNLTTELANLHDVTARFQRIVGEQPPKTAAGTPQLGRKLPAGADAALERALQHSPALLASVENLESAAYDVDARRAAFFPRVDLRARTDNTVNYLGVEGDRRQNVVEVVLNYNLFNGGSDLARQRQFAERKNAAKDQREKACRDLRQTLSIAYNDTQRLKEQVAYTETQVTLLEKTRDAYRDQFNLGQRTLLDLLDTENELLNARRTAVNSDADLSIAYLRTYAGMGELLDFLGLKKLDTGTQPAADDMAKVDPSQICPPEAPMTPSFDREALNARAAAMVEETAKAGLVQGAQPVVAPVRVDPVMPSAKAVDSGERTKLSRGSPQPQAGTPEAEVLRQANGWADAWSRRDYDAYIAFYSPTFIPDGGMAREDWELLRQARLSKPKSVSIELIDIRVRRDNDKRVLLEFHQHYTSNVYRDTTDKVLEFIKVGDKWLIQRESSVPVPHGK